MGDYNNTSGATFSNASGSVRLNNKAVGVNAAKASELAPDMVHAYRLGQLLPAAVVVGKIAISTCTVKVPLVNWSTIVTAYPNFFDGEYDVVVNFRETRLGTAPFNHRRCRLVKVTPSESDMGTTAEAMVDLEFLPLAAEQFGKVGTAR